MHPDHMEPDEIRALIAELDANIARETKIRNELQRRLIQRGTEKPAAERARKLGWGGLIGRGTIWVGVAGAAGTVRKAAGERPGAAAAAATGTTAALAITAALLLLPHDDYRQPPQSAPRPSASAPARQPTLPPAARPDQRSENGRERRPEQPQQLAALPGTAPVDPTAAVPALDTDRDLPPEDIPPEPAIPVPPPTPPMDAALASACVARVQLLDLDVRLLCRR